MKTVLSYALSEIDTIYIMIVVVNAFMHGCVGDYEIDW